MKAVRRICAFIIGLVFFIAGFLKLMDPVGAGLVVEEYFKYLHLSFMMPLAKAAGVGMALLETLLGAALLAGVWPRIVGPGVGIIILAGGIGTLILVVTVLPVVFWKLTPSASGEEAKKKNSEQAEQPEQSENSD